MRPAGEPRGIDGLAKIAILIVSRSRVAWMRKVAAVEAKNRFGELLDTAQREPVTIEKHGRPVAVIVSAEEYMELQSCKLANLRAEIRKGLDDIEAGHTVSGEAAFKELLERLA